MSEHREILKLTQAFRILKDNETAYHNIRELRYRLIGARSVSALMTTLFEGLMRLNVDVITICLVKETVRLQMGSLADLPGGVKESILFASERTVRPVLMPNDKPTHLIGPKGMDVDFFFPDNPGAIKSCLICPMIFRSALVGSLNLGSLSPERFPPDLSSIYLEDLAASTALCLDNALMHEENLRLAITDPLTGLPNRRYFYDHAKRLFDLAKRHNQPLACLYADLNGFKTINDVLGHETGDFILKSVAETLKNNIRQTDVLARMGGDEFAMLLPETDWANAQTLAAKATKIIRAISLAEYSSKSYPISASIGVAVLSDRDRDMNDLLNRADKAMYDVKQSDQIVNLQPDIP